MLAGIHHLERDRGAADDQGDEHHRPVDERGGGVAPGRRQLVDQHGHGHEPAFSVGDPAAEKGDADEVEPRRLLHARHDLGMERPRHGVEEDERDLDDETDIEERKASTVDRAQPGRVGNSSRLDRFLHRDGTLRVHHRSFVGLLFVPAGGRTG